MAHQVRGCYRVQVARAKRPWPPNNRKPIPAPTARPPARPLHPQPAVSKATRGRCLGGDSVCCPGSKKGAASGTPQREGAHMNLLRPDSSGPSSGSPAFASGMVPPSGGAQVAGGPCSAVCLDVTRAVEASAGHRPKRGSGQGLGCCGAPARAESPAAAAGLRFCLRPTCRRSFGPSSLTWPCKKP